MEKRNLHSSEQSWLIQFMQMWCTPSFILITTQGDVLLSCYLISSPHLSARTNWSAWSWSWRRRRAAPRWWRTAWVAAETRLTSCAQNSCRRDPPNRTWSWTRAPWRDRCVDAPSPFGISKCCNNPWQSVIRLTGTLSILRPILKLSSARGTFLNHCRKLLRYSDDVFTGRWKDWFQLQCQREQCWWPSIFTHKCTQPVTAPLNCLILAAFPRAKIT